MPEHPPNMTLNHLNSNPTLYNWSFNLSMLWLPTFCEILEKVNIFFAIK